MSGILAITVAGILAADAGEVPKEQPWRAAGTNTWTRMAPSGNGHWANNMVWCPTREQLLHFVGNGVLAFDREAGRWTRDYEWPGKKRPRPRTNFKNPVGFGTNGKPPAVNTISGLCWDSKRKRVVLTCRGTMAAYDPEAKTWAKLDAKTVLYGKTYPGGPPVYSTGVCYDPVNDEILMLPHFSGPGCPKNRDRQGIDDRVSSHLGTLRFSFEDMTWRRVSDTFGAAAVRRAREAVFALMTKLSDAGDSAWSLRQRNDLAKPADVTALLTESAGSTEHVANLLPADAREPFAKAVPHVQSARDAAAAGKWDETVEACGRALWELDVVIDEPLRVEPSPRCAAEMTYDSENKAIVLFGGHRNLTRTDLKGVGARKYWGLDDTWIYDCATRQWKQIAVERRPPGQRMSLISYDPTTRCIVLVTLGGDRKKRTSTIWTLDVAAGEWRKRIEAPWPGPIVTGSGHGSEGPKPYVPLRKSGLDRDAGLLVVVQPEKGGATYTMKLDLSNAPSEPAPKWSAPPPIKRQVIPPDDPAWVAKLKALPANTWTRANPRSREPAHRGWGTMACDPVRGHVYYFGGGHSTYQVNDVAVYATGANQWVHAAGDHNDYIPWQGWGGIAMLPQGGARAGHQRNTYNAVDGRMYVSCGGTRWYTGYGGSPPDKMVGLPWFYDVDRGGVWRRIKLDQLKLDKGVKPYTGVDVTTPDGRILGPSGEPAGYYGKKYRHRSFYTYDIYANELVVRKVEKPYPDRRAVGGEGRRVCFMPDRNQFFYYNGIDTWIFDVKTNTFRNMQPPSHPGTGRKKIGPRTIEYVTQQGVVYALIGKGEQWCYSPEKNVWTKLNDKKGRGGGPYAQTVNVAKYGVLVAQHGGKTWVMRPDFSGLKWK